MAVAKLDLDGFKDLNDTLGHPVGDRLLQEVARRLSSISDGTRVYRLGQDDFVLLLENCGDPLVATEVVDAALKRLTAQFDIDGHRLFIAASVGLAIAPAHGSNVDDLLANADLALYDAKAAGGRLCRMYVPALRARAKHRRELDSELRRACANQEFVLYFQPQVRSSDGAVVGAEALLRWHHPERGILAPGLFIDVLCESAVAIETGRSILTTACKTAASWRAKGLAPVRLGVNIFPAQFRNGSLLRDVEHALSESGLPPEALELEITENIALGREDGTLSPLKALRAKGVGIAFDDFGTGYASLSYLTRYPLTRIKIDRSFIRKIGTQSAGEDTAIVRSIIVMAPAVMTFKILPNDRPDDEAFARQPVGSGPFTYGGQRTEGGRTYAVFPRNPAFGKRVGRANLPTIEAVWMVASRQPAADFKAGKVHLVLTRATADLASFRSAPAATAPDGSHRPGPTGSVDGHRTRRYVARADESITSPSITAIRSWAAVLKRRICTGSSLTPSRAMRFSTSCFRAGFPDHHHALDGPFPYETWPCNPLAGRLDDSGLAGSLAPGHGEIKLELKYPADDPAVERACQQIQQSLSEYKIAIRLAPRSPADLRKQVTVDTDFQLAYCQHDFADDWYDVGGWLDPRRIGPPGRLGDRNFMSYLPSPDFASLFAQHAGASRLR